MTVGVMKHLDGQEVKKKNVRGNRPILASSDQVNTFRTICALI